MAVSVAIMTDGLSKIPRQVLNEGVQSRNVWTECGRIPRRVFPALRKKKTACRRLIASIVWNWVRSKEVILRILLWCCTWLITNIPAIIFMFEPNLLPVMLLYRLRWRSRFWSQMSLSLCLSFCYFIGSIEKCFQLHFSASFAWTRYDGLTIGGLCFGSNMMGWWLEVYHLDRSMLGFACLICVCELDLRRRF